MKCRCPDYCGTILIDFVSEYIIGSSRMGRVMTWSVLSSANSPDFTTTICCMSDSGTYTNAVGDSCQQLAGLNRFQDRCPARGPDTQVG